MATEPSWTWRLRADAADRWWVRWWYKFLRWCTESHSLPNRLVSAVGLVFGIGYLAMYAATTQSVPAAIYVVGAVAVLIALKGLVAHVTKVLFREKTIVGGAPTADRFENLVPQGAQKVALVGQNLASRMGDKYGATLQGLRALLSRGGPGSNRAVEEIWLVLQTPLALFSVHPEAARHLQSITLPALRRLAQDLNDNRVKVAFHPAATLSMLVVDWHRETRLAVVTPKVQTLPIIDRRLSVVVSGDEFDTIAPHFDRFLFEATQSEFPGAATATISDAAERLEELFRLSVVDGVKEYLQGEAKRAQSAQQTEAGGEVLPRSGLLEQAVAPDPRSGASRRPSVG